MRRIVVSLIIVSLLSACGEEYKARKADKARWNEAQATDTLEAYSTFVDTYPDSEYLDAAQSRVNEIYGEQAREELQDEFGGCAPDAGEATEFDMIYFGEKTLIGLDALRDEYHWDDGLGLLWKWHDSRAGFRMPGGNTMFLAASTTNPRYGIAYTMGFGGEGFGTLCIDNLQTYGVVYFAPEGLSFSEGSVLIYPR